MSDVSGHSDSTPVPLRSQQNGKDSAHREDGRPAHSRPSTSELSSKGGLFSKSNSSYVSTKSTNRTVTSDVTRASFRKQLRMTDRPKSGREKLGQLGQLFG